MAIFEVKKFFSTSEIVFVNQVVKIFINLPSLLLLIDFSTHLRYCEAHNRLIKARGNLLMEIFH